MSPHELMELAALDALGLLEPDEREEFEAAFRSAEPALQAQLRREQLRAARSQVLTPNVEPPPGLRARVLAAMREAMQAAKARRVAAGVSVFRPSGVSSIWRIGAIGSLAAAIAFGVAAIEVNTQNRTMREALASNVLSDNFLKEYGVKFDQALFSPETRLVGFRPTTQGKGKATLLWNSETKTGQIYCKDLPSDQGEYEVVLVDASGRTVRALITFAATSPGVKNGGQLEGIDLESQTIAIRRVGSDELILKSQRL